jgi:hypothetical protein
LRGGCAAVALIIALAAVSCEGGGSDDAATPPAIRTAVSLAEAVVLENDDAGEGWEPLSDDTGTPGVTAGADAILDRAFKAWAGCVGNILAGGFVGVGRAGTASSPRFSDGSGRLVAGASAIFTEQSRADQVVDALGESREICSALGDDFRVEISSAPAAPPDAAASYRMTANYVTRNGTFSETFDLVVLRGELALSLLVFKGFGANDAGQSDIVARAASKLQ